VGGTTAAFSTRIPPRAVAATRGDMLRSGRSVKTGSPARALPSLNKKHRPEDLIPFDNENDSFKDF